MLDDLNPKMQKFVQHYAKSGNETAAAKAAGYSERSAHVTGCRLLKNAKVRKALAELSSQIASPRIKSAEERQIWLSLVIDGEVTESKMNPEGGIVEVPASIMARLRAAELLAKMRGELIIKADVRHHADTAAFKEVPTDLLRERAALLRQQRLLERKGKKR